ncbi:MAG: hypothetical protein B2I17_03335 [Thermoplasmatales archaeon B_DKE]|nr:MAG: hypothetical protein B2I17_03335 [Thermoplasmatales archaeon B_DKE]
MVIVDRVHIENFRSIKNVDLKFHQLNAIIGPNNAGKSNILKALSIVLGETYPSSRMFEENDYFDRDLDKVIKIDVRFDNSFIEPRYLMEISGFRLECYKEDFTYIALDSKGEPLKYNNGGVVRVSQDMRDEVPLLFLDVDRQSAHQVRATQWTLYGKILRQIEKNIPDINKKQFFQDVLASFNSKIFHVSPGSDLKYLEEQLKTTIKDHTGFDLLLQLSVLDSLEVIKNVRPYITDGLTSQKYDPEDMGAGTQSALTVSIARAYSDIVKKSVILAIEEPELHFHPQACRNMYNTFKNMSSSGLQIIYTTHSQSFVDISDFDSLHIVRKAGHRTVVESGLKLSTSNSLSKNKVVTKFNEQVNQTLFADHVVLVEGVDDEIACRAMIEKLGYDIFKNNISVTSCGGIDNVPAIASVLQSLKIDTLALVDEDPGNVKTLSIRNKIENIIGESQILLQSPNLEGLFGQQTKFDQITALSYFRNHTGSIPKVYSDLVGRLSH